VFLAIVVLPIVLVLAGFAVTGGLRIRTPLGSYHDSLGELEEIWPEAEFGDVADAGSRMCFLQCTDWSSRVELVLPAEVTCTEVEEKTSNWLGEKVDAGQIDRRRGLECRYSLCTDSGKGANSSISLYTDGSARASIAASGCYEFLNREAGIES